MILVNCLNMYCTKLWNMFAFVSSLNLIPKTKITIKLCLTVLLNVSLNKYVHKSIYHTHRSISVINTCRANCCDSSISKIFLTLLTSSKHVSIRLNKTIAS